VTNGLAYCGIELVTVTKEFYDPGANVIKLFLYIIYELS
jgi:hypothetical protein